jgi:hypothetical protein
MQSNCGTFDGFLPVLINSWFCVHMSKQKVICWFLESAVATPRSLTTDSLFHFTKGCYFKTRSCLYLTICCVASIRPHHVAVTPENYSFWIQLPYNYYITCLLSLQPVFYKQYEVVSWIFFITRNQHSVRKKMQRQLNRFNRTMFGFTAVTTYYWHRYSSNAFKKIWCHCSTGTSTVLVPELPAVPARDPLCCIVLHYSYS